MARKLTRKKASKHLYGGTTKYAPSRCAGGLRPSNRAGGTMAQLFYLQDKRQIVGNDMMWWAKNKRGYTSDISNAEVWTEDEAFRQHRSRETDIPWPKEYIDGKTRPAVDFQYVDREVAMQGRETK